MAGNGREKCFFCRAESRNYVKRASARGKTGTFHQRLCYESHQIGFIIVIYHFTSFSHLADVFLQSVFSEKGNNHGIV